MSRRERREGQTAAILLLREKVGTWGTGWKRRSFEEEKKKLLKYFFIYLAKEIFIL